MIENNSELNDIVDRIVHTVSPLKIYLFGSFARGDNHADSDYDLMVVVKDGAGNRMRQIQDIYVAIAKNRATPVDVLLDYESDFERKQNDPTIEREVINEGILLYGK